MHNQEVLLSVSRDTLVDVSNYLGYLPYREVSNLILELDESLRKNNSLSSQPLDKYNINVSIRDKIVKYLYTKPYGEVFRFVHQLETSPQVFPQVPKESVKTLDSQDSLIDSFDDGDNGDLEEMFR